MSQSNGIESGERWSRRVNDDVFKTAGGTQSRPSSEKVRHVLRFCCPLKILSVAYSILLVVLVGETLYYGTSTPAYIFLVHAMSVLSNALCESKTFCVIGLVGLPWHARHAPSNGHQLLSACQRTHLTICAAFAPRWPVLRGAWRCG